MTLGELIAWGDRMKPDNRFTTEEKTLWINTIEANIQQEALQLSLQIQYEYETDKDTELILKAPHDEIYRWYLLAQLSAANEEYDRYQNEMEMFNKAWETFMLWVCTKVEPVNETGGGGSSGGGGGSSGGNDGFSPIVEIKNVPGGHRVSITDINGTKYFDVMDGKDGKTPVKGTDYFTASDKSAIAAEVAGMITPASINAVSLEQFNAALGDVNASLSAMDEVIG